MTKKILIIDDEEDMRIYLKTLFRKAGYDTDTAANGEDALAKIKEVKPDLLTLDIMMPKKSGLSFFKTLREELGDNLIPVIVLSGLSGHKEFFEGDAGTGPTVFVEKPIVVDSFLAKAKEMLGE
jgi:DNA-binding response OmpR family regulator